MLIRPSFCCNCGERIERTAWKLWTSRRFCDLCATDFTLQEIIPKAVVLLAAVILVLGTVNYFAGGDGRANIAATKAIEKRPFQTAVADNSRSNTAVSNVSAPPVENRSLPPANPAGERTTARTLTAPPPANPRGGPATLESAGPVYFCGAETKKGTPCSRKVKGNVRCWQHTGMPAMLPPDKLLVSR